MSEQRIPPDESLDELYAHAPVGYLSLSDDWRVTRVNDTLLEWLDRPREQVLGQRIQALLTTGARIFYETHCALVLRKQGVLREASLDFAGPGGAARPMLVSWRPVNDAGGRPLGYRVMLVDARERRTYERDLIAERERARAVAEQLRLMNAELEQRVAAAVAEREAAAAKIHEMQKLETIGQLTGGVAHDFNNLLAAIIGSLELLQRRLPEGDARAKRQLDIALQAADRGAALTQRLLAFARRQYLQPRPVDLAELAGGLLDLLRRSIGPVIDIDLHVVPDLPPVLVDANQFELALLNLAINARDAMPLGGRLTITADRASGRLPADLADGAYARVRVIDTGFGMNAETLRRAVEPFFTTKGVGKGTGLGLSMVHGLAAQSGGAMTIDSTPGEGTTVTLWLPSAGQVAAGTVAPPARAAGRERAATLLLVDDDPLVAMSAEDMLTDLGYLVRVASSAGEALGLLRDGAAGVDLLVTDYAMPGMTGTELARKAREGLPGLPVLLITGYADLPAEQNGEWPRLSKPFTQETLAQAVSGLLRPADGVSARPLRSAGGRG